MTRKIIQFNKKKIKYCQGKKQEETLCIEWLLVRGIIQKVPSVKRHYTKSGLC